MGSQIAENPRMGKRLLISHWYNSRQVIWITMRINEECWVSSLKRTHRKCSKKKAVLKNYAILNGKHCVGVSLEQTRRPSSCNSIEKRLQHRWFSVNIAKILRTPILKNMWERLLLRFKSYKSAVLCSFVTTLVIPVFPRNAQAWFALFW